MDYFSMMSVKSLGNILPEWDSWLQSKLTDVGNQQANEDYRFPVDNGCKPILLGHSFNLFTVYGGEPARAFERWRLRINRAIRDELAHKLLPRGMTLPLDAFIPNYNERGMVRNFQSLGPLASHMHIPVIALTHESALYCRGTGFSSNDESILADVRDSVNRLVLLFRNPFVGLPEGTENAIYQSQIDANTVMSIPQFRTAMAQGQYSAEEIGVRASNIREFFLNQNM